MFIASAPGPMNYFSQVPLINSGSMLPSLGCLGKNCWAACFQFSAQVNFSGPSILFTKL